MQQTETISRSFDGTGERSYPWLRNVSGDSSRAAWLIKGSRNILYDAGMAYSAGQMIENIKRELGGEPLAAVILSHSHYDHVAGVPFLRREWPEMQVYGSEYAKHVLEKESAQDTIRELSDNAARGAGFACAPEYDRSALSVDVAVRDGDVLTVGKDGIFLERADSSAAEEKEGRTGTAAPPAYPERKPETGKPLETETRTETGKRPETERTAETRRIRVYGTPGHTRCSLSFLIHDTLLLASETIGVFGERWYMPCYLVGYEMSRQSLEKLAAAPAKRLFISHRGVLEEENLPAVFDWLRAQLKRTKAEIIEILRTCPDEETQVREMLRDYHDGMVSEHEQPNMAFVLNAKATLKLIRRECMENEPQTRTQKSPQTAAGRRSRDNESHCGGGSKLGDRK